MPWGLRRKCSLNKFHNHFVNLFILILKKTTTPALRQFLLIFVLLFLTNCGTIVGGSKYYAHVVVNDRPKAKIIYQGSVMGIRNASFLAKRRDANKFSVTIREVDCPDQTYNFTTRSFRGWSLVGSVFGWTGTAGGVLLPWGVGLDLLTGALWKPNVKEKGIVKSNYKNYIRYPL